MLMMAFFSPKQCLACKVDKHRGTKPRQRDIFHFHFLHGCLLPGTAGLRMLFLQFYSPIPYKIKTKKKKKEKESRGAFVQCMKFMSC